MKTVQTKRGAKVMTQPMLKQISVTLKDFVPQGSRQVTLYTNGGMINVSERLYTQIKEFALHHQMTLDAATRRLCQEICSQA